MESSSESLRQTVFDTDGYKKRAACVCVRNENEDEILLVSSSRHKNCWIIPGGGIEEHEKPEDAAVREVFEEAGVTGRIDRLLGIFEHPDRRHRTTVYLMIVDKELDNWDEKERRVRRWFSSAEAKCELDKHKPVQGTYLSLLKGFASHLNGGKCSNGAGSSSLGNSGNNNSSSSSLHSTSTTSSSSASMPSVCFQASSSPTTTAESTPAASSPCT